MMPRSKRNEVGALPDTPVGTAIESRDGKLLVWNGRAWRPLENWETPEEFVRWLESTPWPNDTRATVPVPPPVIKRAIRDIRRLLSALEQKNKGNGA
jgi:predicted RNA-binding Zn ribbon-like protein